MSRWLLTRPLQDSRRVAAALRARRHQAVIAPVIEIVFRDRVPPSLDGVQAVLFTSQNGVRAYAATGVRCDRPAFAVGRSTAEAAIAAGFAEVVSADGDSAALAALVAARLSPGAGDLLHVAGTRPAGDLAGALQAHGFVVHRAVLYEARPLDRLPDAAKAALIDGKLSGALFFSPRTAEVFARLVTAAGLTSGLRGLSALCLSAAVADRLGAGDWGEIRIAERPELPAILALLDSIDEAPDR